MRSFLVQLAVAVLLLAAGFVLALTGAVLLGIGLMLWAALVLLGILLLDLIHRRGHLTGHLQTRRLVDALHVEHRSQTFQAQRVSYARLGVILGFACTNVGSEPLKKLRVRLDELRLKQVDAWVRPSWFVQQFLEWEDGAESTDLAPTEELTCFLVRHDAEWVIAAYTPFANRAVLPHSLDSGRWRAQLSWRALEFEPLILKEDFEVERNPNPNFHAGELRFAE